MQLGPVGRVDPSVDYANLPVTTEDITVPTRHGDVAARVHRPADAVPSAPVYVNFHGGGYVFRHPEQDDPLCRYLAVHAGVVVVNVDYDVAPQVRFPVPVEEAYDAVVWAADPARPWDGTRLCVGGQSAGGGLAAAVARLSLERGGPAIALQVLHYPPLDLVTPGDQKHAAGRSIISVPMTQIFDTVYVPRAADRRDRLASPAWGSNAEGIEGIAPALVITCELDRLHDEGVRYAEALEAAGALREHVDLAGQDHGYNGLRADVVVVDRAYAVIAGWVREAV